MRDLIDSNIRNKKVQVILKNNLNYKAPLLVLVRTAFGMILRSLGNKKATLSRAAFIYVKFPRYAEAINRYRGEVLKNLFYSREFKVSFINLEINNGVTPRARLPLMTILLK